LSNTIAQIFGILASVSAMVSHQQKRKENTIIFNSIMNFLAMTQFMLLFALSGAFIKFANILRNIVLYILHKKGKSTPTWLTIIFVSAVIIGGLLGWKNWFSIFPIIGVSTYTIALCQKNMTLIRGANIVVLSCWIVYSLAIGAYGGAIGLCVELSSVIIAVIRLDVLKRGANHELS